MYQDSSLADLQNLLTQVRQGNSRAATEFVERFAPEIRTEVRQHLRAGRIRRLVDSEDVCQSVLATMLLRLADGEFQLEDPRQLGPLLLRIARNKVNGQMRRHYAARRDIRQTEPLSVNGQNAVHHETPSARLVHEELVAEVRSRLAPDERRIAEMRKSGQTWSDIAQAMNATPEGIRKRFERAFHTAAVTVLGEDDSSEIQ